MVGRGAGPEGRRTGMSVESRGLCARDRNAVRSGELGSCSWWCSCRARQCRMHTIGFASMPTVYQESGEGADQRVMCGLEILRQVSASGLGGVWACGRVGVSTGMPG